MNEITPPVRWGKTKEGLYWLIDATGEMITLDQINALLIERNELIKGLREIAKMGRVCKDFDLCKHESCADSSGSTLKALELINKYGPIGGE